MVRQLQPTETGLPMQLYFFTDTVVWVDYELSLIHILGT